MIKFEVFSGTVTMINDYWINGNEQLAGCIKLMSVEKEDETIVNFIVEPVTYFVRHEMIKVGDKVTGFYDGNAPVPLIYPPQYKAIVMAKNVPYYNVKADYFDKQLISSDGQLKLNIGPKTRKVLENGQAFTGNLANRYIIVVYGVSTKSIPAQTTPYEIVVMCMSNK